MINTNEKIRIESLSNWYLKEQIDFDKRLIKYRYQTIQPKLVGTRVLELGPAEGEMTQFLIDDFDNLTIIEGSSDLLKLIPNHQKLEKIHSLFENFKPKELFDSIILEHILEHVDNPVDLLIRAKDWLAPGGRIFIGVPNGNSFHRLAAVKMGLLQYPCQLNSKDIELGHRRVYTPETFQIEIEKSSLSILEIGGVYFKPLSNSQIQKNWTEEMIQGFYELGKSFPKNAAEIYAVCQR
jgi:2-polyprenyl-3-methyl-5-hydroxy-6-metoxy-1,4-benzoquinol methylase